MPKVNHHINRFFIDRLGGETGLNEIKKKHPKWRISSGGLDETLIHDKIVQSHGKENARQASKNYDRCVKTIYNKRSRKKP
jgi:hypothetical protein